MNGIIPLLTYIFVVTFTPGPNNIMSMTNGMRYGYRGILRFIAGVLCGFAIIALSAGMLNLFMANLIPASGKLSGSRYWQLFTCSTWPSASCAPGRWTTARKAIPPTASGSALACSS